MTVCTDDCKDVQNACMHVLEILSLSLTSFLSIPLCIVNAQQKETEAIKLMTVRAGLLDMSRSWELMGKKCSVLAQSQQASYSVICVHEYTVRNRGS